MYTSVYITYGLVELRETNVSMRTRRLVPRLQIAFGLGMRLSMQASRWAWHVLPGALAAGMRAIHDTIDNT